jgi:hypothetical protein
MLPANASIRGADGISQHKNVQSSIAFPGMKFVKGTRSFRIVGDMYDRSWTCWCLSSIPEIEPLCGWVKNDDDESKLTADGFHKQRRVLEHRLFQATINKVYSNNDSILTELDKKLPHDVRKISTYF